jgi:hypothetical protein
MTPEAGGFAEGGGEMCPLLDALHEVSRYSGTNRLFWWREASMRKLQGLGFVEQWLPPSVAERKRMKARPWRITEAGRLVLADANKGEAP